MTADDSNTDHDRAYYQDHDHACGRGHEQHDVTPSSAQLAVFAHELRGSLTVIAGYTELLRRPLGKAETASALDGIERAIRRADSLCGDMLAGRTPTELHVRDRARLVVAELLGHVAEEQRAATGREIHLTLAEEHMPAVQILGDREALARVLTNLIGNAAKYSPAGAPIDLSLSASPSHALLEVADRGHGIPAEERERVFAPFERLERDMETPGHGLGLAVAADIIRAHDGSIEVDDRLGGGTVMRVTLPLATAPAATRNEESPPATRPAAS